MDSRIISRIPDHSYRSDRVDDSTIAASTGAAFRPSASRRARLRHDGLRTGADAINRQQRGAARRIVRVQRLHQHQLRPSNFRCFCSRRPSRFTRAICISPDPSDHDADDAGIDWWFGRMEREAGLFAADEKHLFADAGADRIDRDQRPPRGWRSAASGCTSISLIPTKFSSFRVATTAPMTRASCICDGGDGGSPLLLLLQLYFIDDATMAASTGQSFRPDAIRASFR